MPDPQLLDHIRAALADKYRVDREIGRGGMATVYLAHDVRLDRAAALKVLDPVTQEIIGRDRFKNEIAITAQLGHPHILPVHEAGEAGGLLYYVMPFVAGGSLHDKLDRESTLPLEEVVELVRQVSSALSFAHQRGIVHRDIKPHNILLTEEHAVVADFGIARSVIREDAGRLTAPGGTIGTPEYMSPEQLTGAPNVDARADQYSLAAVAYEMLSGNPPFTGRDARTVAARQLFDPVPPLRNVRSLPAEVELVIRRALSKAPSDRWPTITAFAEALAAGAALPTGSTGPSRAMTRRRRWGVGIALAAAAAAVGLVLWDGRDRGPDPSPSRLVVMPFVVEGRIDTSATLPGRIAARLATRLAGVGDLDLGGTDSALGEWMQVARTHTPTRADETRIAQRAGAGRMVVGSFLITDSLSTIDAAIMTVPDRTYLARVERTGRGPGAMDRLVDEVAIELLARVLDEPVRRFPMLRLPPPEAAKAYLSGIARLRRGEYRRAIGDFQHATTLDSSFALAYLSQSMAAQLAAREELWDVTAAAAYQHREFLPPPEQQMLLALFGSSVQWRPVLAGWGQAVDSMPGEWEPAVHLAYRLAEWGPAIGITTAREQAANLLRRTLERDSALAPAMELLIELAVARRDSAETQVLGSRYLAVNSGADRADYVRWLMASVHAERPSTEAVSRLLTNLSPAAVARLIGTAQVQGMGIEEAADAARELQRRAQTPREAWLAALVTRQLALNRGRAEDRPLPVTNLVAVAYEALLAVVEGLYWGGDSAAAAEIVRQRGPVVDRLPLRPREATDPVLMDVCAVALWRARLGGDLGRLVAQLRQVGGADERAQTSYIPICLQTLDALEISRRMGAPAGREMERLDSLLSLRPATNAYILFAATMTLAELRESAGDIRAALATVRRRSYSASPTFGTTGLSTMLHHEARLAALVGDTAGAIDALSRYLALRHEATGKDAVEAAAARRQLGRLLPDH